MPQQQVEEGLAMLRDILCRTSSPAGAGLRAQQPLVLTIASLRQWWIETGNGSARVSPYS